MSDIFSLHFSATETTAQNIIRDGGVLHEALHQWQLAYQRLLGSGLQSAFLDELDARNQRLQQQWQSLAHEVIESGQDLQQIVEKARQIDVDCAKLFGQHGLRLANSPSLQQADQENRRIRWRELEDDTTAWIKSLESELSPPNRWLNLAAGVLDDYEALLKDARRRLAHIQEQIETLDNTSWVDMQSGSYVSRLDRFNLSDLIDQGGISTCVAVAAINSLIMRGYNITPDETSAIIASFEEQNRRGDYVKIPVIGYIGPGSGFDTNVAMEIFAEMGLHPEARYASPEQMLAIDILPDCPLPPTFEANEDLKFYDLNKGNVTDQAVTQLISEIQSDDPVYIVTSTEFNGNPNGFHAMNVLAINLDDAGQLTSVTVATNWGENSGLRQIPADVFLRDWARASFYSIIV